MVTPKVACLVSTQFRVSKSLVLYPCPLSPPSYPCMHLSMLPCTHPCTHPHVHPFTQPPVFHSNRAQHWDCLCETGQMCPSPQGGPVQQERVRATAYQQRASFPVLAQFTPEWLLGHKRKVSSVRWGPGIV